MHHRITTPIACTLTAGEYDDRTGDPPRSPRARCGPGADGGGERLTFADTPGSSVTCARRRRRACCCAFLRMDLQRTDDGLVLDITGPQDARALIAELLA